MPDTQDDSLLDALLDSWDPNNTIVIVVVVHVHLATRLESCPNHLQRPGS
jgi:hypothetical protein